MKTAVLFGGFLRPTPPEEYGLFYWVIFMGRPRGVVQGFGVNDANYVVSRLVSGRMVSCKAYVTWKDIISRCYSEKRQKKNPTYIGVTVCDEWRSFMAFREWWLESHVDGWQIDKDLLTDNNQYSPDSCIYVPAWLNTFTIDRNAVRGEFPIGVDYHKSSKSFRSMCNNPATGKQVTIGRFKTPEAAHLAWRARKLEYAAQMKNEMDAIDARIYPRVVEIINRAK